MSIDPELPHRHELVDELVVSRPGDALVPETDVVIVVEQLLPKDTSHIR
jgi:hypothetical protein